MRPKENRKNERICQELLRIDRVREMDQAPIVNRRTCSDSIESC